MRGKKKQLWSFGKRGTNGTSPNSEAKPQPENRSAKWYRSITELPLNKFIDCLVNDNLAALVISGFPDQVTLSNAWTGIQYEYADARGDSEFKVYVQLLREAAGKKNDLNRIYIAIKELSVILEFEPKSDEIIAMRDHYAQQLNDLVTSRFTFDFNDPDKYVANLQRCYTRSGGLKISLGLLAAKLEAIERKFGEKSKTDASYFQALLITLSDAAGYVIKDDITVFEFCERIKRLNK